MGVFVAPVATVTDFLSTVPLGPIQPLQSEGGFTVEEMYTREREREGERVVGCFTYRRGRMYHGRTKVGE